jgi:DNA-binding PadR family transcriptional regulator
LDFAMRFERTCACEGQTLDRLLQPAVMAVLSEGPLHGYGLVDRLKESPMMKGAKPDATGVYRLLSTLEDLGMVTHHLADSDLGPSKRVFELTTAGQACLSKWIDTLERYQQDIVQLIQFMRTRGGKPG